MSTDNGVSGKPEEWRVVAGHPDYIVSSEGRVRHRRVGAPILRGDVDRYGYQRVQLNGKRKKVHRIVCEAFHGPGPKGQEVAHWDGNRRNNRPQNLRWATRSENVRDAIRHGTANVDIMPAVRASAARDRRGHRTATAKFTPEQVAEMRQRRDEGWSVRRIAREFGCAPGTAHKIVTGKHYAG